MEKAKDPVQRSDELDEKLSKATDVEEQIGALAKEGKRTRKLVLYLAISVGVNVALTIVLAVVFYNQNIIQDKLIKNQNNIVASCNAGNEFRRSNLRIWDYLLDQPPTVPRTIDEQRQLNKFRNIVTDTFRLRDCEKLK